MSSDRFLTAKQVSRYLSSKMVNNWGIFILQVSMATVWLENVSIGDHMAEFWQSRGALYTNIVYVTLFWNFSNKTSWGWADKLTLLYLESLLRNVGSNVMNSWNGWNVQNYCNGWNGWTVEMVEIVEIVEMGEMDGMVKLIIYVSLYTMFTE